MAHEGQIGKNIPPPSSSIAEIHSSSIASSFLLNCFILLPPPLPSQKPSKIQIKYPNQIKMFFNSGLLLGGGKMFFKKILWVSQIIYPNQQIQIPKSTKNPKIPDLDFSNQNPFQNPQKIQIPKSTSNLKSINNPRNKISNAQNTQNKISISEEKEEGPKYPNTQRIFFFSFHRNKFTEEEDEGEGEEDFLIGLASRSPWMSFEEILLVEEEEEEEEKEEEEMGNGF